MKKHARLLGLLLAFAIPFGYMSSAAATVRVCGNVTFYCQYVLGWGSGICASMCDWG